MNLDNLLVYLVNCWDQNHIKNPDPKIFILAGDNSAVLLFSSIIIVQLYYLLHYFSVCKVF